MAKKRITEVGTAGELKDDLYFLISQIEGPGGKATLRKLHIQFLLDLFAQKVDKDGTGSILYGTDENGNQIVLLYSGNAAGSTAVVRDNNGMIKATAPDNEEESEEGDFHVVNLGYLKRAVFSELIKKADKADTFTKDEVLAYLLDKADKTDTFTKAEVIAYLLEKADKSDTFTKADVLAYLLEKADKTDTFTKDQILEKLKENGENLTVWGDGAQADGTSSTDAIDRGITNQSSDSEIIAEWEIGEDRFALIRANGGHIGGNNCLVLSRNGFAHGNGNIVGPNASAGVALGTGTRNFGKYGITTGRETYNDAQGGDAGGIESENHGYAGIARGDHVKTQNSGEAGFGSYNKDDVNTKRKFSVGNGTSSSRHNCLDAGGDPGNEYFKVGESVEAGAQSGKGYIKINDEIVAEDELKDLLDFIGGMRLEFDTSGSNVAHVTGVGSNTRKDVVIPSNLKNGCSVTTIDSDSFFNNSNIETVTIPISVGYIGGRAFSGCTNLTHVYFTAIPTIEDSAFPENCFMIFPDSIVNEAKAALPYFKDQICSNVIEVGTEAELRSIASRCNNGESFANYLIVLKNDIELSNTTWVSIGNSSNPFRGSFDGRGHTISNMKRIGGTIGQNVGLFGVVSSPDGGLTTIKNFKLTGSIYSSNGGENAGTVISAVKPSTSGTVNVNIGGIWSAVNFDAASAKMTCVGGILGTIAWLTGAQQTTINIDSCRYSGTLDSPSAGCNNYGGIMGYPKEACGPREINITNCIFDGVMILQASAPDDNGGIMGYFKGNGSIGAQTNIHVANCIVAGQFQHTRKSDQTNTGYVVSEKSGSNTDYSVTNVYYCNDSDRHTGGAMGGWYGYMKGDSTDPSEIVKINVSARSMGELIEMTSGFSNDSKWHFYNDGGTIPVPAIIYDKFIQ